MKQTLANLKAAARPYYVGAWQILWITPAVLLLVVAALCVAVAYCSYSTGLNWFKEVR